MSKKFKLNFNEEQVVEAEIVGGGYIRWNVYFTSGVSAPLKEEPAVEESAEEEKVEEKKTICSFFGFSCQKE